MKKYKKEIEIINKFQNPILAICLGFELVGKVFGCVLDCLDKKYSKRIIREELAKVFGIIFTTESPIRRAIKEIAQAKPNKH